MRKIYFLSIAAIFSLSLHSQIINIPDPVFKNVLLTQPCAALDEPYEITYQYIDTNADGEIEVSEAQAVYGLNVSNKNITSLQGIEYFTSLYYLECYNNLITSLDLSSINPYEVGVSGNPLTTLLLPQTILYGLAISNTALTSITLPTLRDGNDATFSITNNPFLQYINAKNGTAEPYDINNEGTISMTVQNNPALQSVCVDDITNPYFPQNQQYQTEADFWAATINDPNVLITSYCSFTPSGQFNTITGNINFDCGGSNLPVQNVPITVAQGLQNGTTYGNLTGNFIAYANSGGVTITPQLPNPAFYNVTPSNFTYDFATTSETANNNFCLSPNGVHPDLEINLIPLTPAVPGFSPTYKLVLKNIGNQSASGTMSLTFDDVVMDFTTSSPAILSQAGNLLTWNYNNLMPFESISTNITMHLNSPMDTPPVNGGYILNFDASVNNVGDETPENNTFVLHQTVVNSLDPNDKTCLEGNTVGPEMIGEYVHYMIRFENDGTANAQNIVVKDLIDTSKFDVSTLIPISGSAPFETRISDTNKVEFIFQNINLPFDDAINDGYVAFKIKTTPTLTVGDTFSNSASIYFDYNFPIITNTATTTIQQLGTNDFEFSKFFTLYPNPAKNILNIKADLVQMKSISIYNMLGQLLIAVTNAEKISEIDVSNLEAGNYFIRINSDKGSATGRFLKE